uniref:TATA-box binding protein n=1 Tax=Lotharella globosa TaxID=91324 RepID=A0A7S4DG97_9EUKA
MTISAIPHVEGKHCDCQMSQRPRFAPRQRKRTKGKSAPSDSTSSGLDMKVESEETLREAGINKWVESEAKNEAAAEGTLDIVPSTVSSEIIPTGQRPSTLYPPEVRCVFAFLHVGCELDLVRVVTRVRGAEYNPKRFHAVVLRIREPKATAVIYASGKIVCMGARNERAANIACRKFVRILQKVGYPQAKFAPTEEEPLIRNVMAKVKVPFPVSLDALATHKEHSVMIARLTSF